MFCKKEKVSFTSAGSKVKVVPSSHRLFSLENNEATSSTGKNLLATSSWWNWRLRRRLSRLNHCRPRTRTTLGHFSSAEEQICCLAALDKLEDDYFHQSSLWAHLAYTGINKYAVFGLVFFLIPSYLDWGLCLSAKGGPGEAGAFPRRTRGTTGGSTVVCAAASHAVAWRHTALPSGVAYFLDSALSREEWEILHNYKHKWNDMVSSSPEFRRSEHSSNPLFISSSQRISHLIQQVWAKLSSLFYYKNSSQAFVVAGNEKPLWVGEIKVNPPQTPTHHHPPLP